jgi:hypothetical protein
MTLRQMMIDRIYSEVPNTVNTCSRYRHIFYTLSEEDTKRGRRQNLKAENSNRVNLYDLDSLEDQELFDVYNRFCMRYSTWM